MQTLKQDAKNVAITKQRLEKEKKQLLGIMKTIDKENADIKTTIRKNKSMIDKIQNDKRLCPNLWLDNVVY